MTSAGQRILLVSVHGLIRARDPELGHDPDTGGQVLYVLELAKALAQAEPVAGVDLLTRLVDDPSVSADYARPEEPIAPRARIVRIPFGPRRYTRKESLWDYLDQLVDRYLVYARTTGRRPDLIHSHYGDAGYVAGRLSSLLGVPFIHTAHSLGRYKKKTLIAAGKKETALERQFHFTRRSAAEEEILADASLIIASTRHEIIEQYQLYTNFDPHRAVVVPPGTDVSRFRPPDRREPPPAVVRKVDRFLADARKPLVLWIGRPEPRKNPLALMHAFGEDGQLREQANLLIVGGSRTDIAELDEVGRGTWEDILRALDRYDLYGHVALPKSHEPADIPEFYRLAATRRGVCVNPSVSETFGLTLIEAAASGLPVVATASGGPKDIIANCRNGIALDSVEPEALAAGLRDALSNPKRWAEWSRNGIKGVQQFYTWDAHVRRYLRATRGIWRRERKRTRRELARRRPGGLSPFLSAEWAFVFDLDRTLVGDRAALGRLVARIRDDRGRVGFGIVTGRRLESALWVLRDWEIDPPDVLITGVGSAIHYGPDWRPDAAWENHIRQDWRRADVARTLERVPGLSPQAESKLGPYKLSYYVSPKTFPGSPAVKELLRAARLRARVIYSESRYLDVLPRRASKGQAVRYLSFKWGIPIDHFVVAGDSGSDADMLTGDTRCIVVANHSPELEFLRGRKAIYFAAAPYAAGILEGLVHFGVPPPALAPPGEEGASTDRSAASTQAGR